VSRTAIILNMNSFPSKSVAAFALLTIGGMIGISQENRRPDPDLPKTKKIAYLGILSCPLEDSLRQHLELPDGFGLQVKDVMKDGPAATAALTPHDVLTMIDDQRLTTVSHLALLVRSYAPGEKVSLTFIRKGKEEVVEVILGEREVADQPFFTVHPHLNNPVGQGNPTEWQHAVQCYQDSLNQWLQQNGRNSKVDRRLNPRQGAKLPAPGNSGKPPSISVRPGFPIQVFGSSGIVKIDNGFGEVTIKTTDEGHQIIVKDENGEVVHEGYYDAEKGTAGLPKEAQEHLKKMKLDDLKILVPSAPVMNPPAEKAGDKQPEVKKVSDPMPSIEKSSSGTKSDLL